MKDTRLTVLRQGSVQLSCTEGHMVLGNEDAVCFYIDPKERAYVECSSTHWEQGESSWMLVADIPAERIAIQAALDAL
jgi:hypothetical protein